MRYVITDRCSGCGLCMEVCVRDAIEEVRHPPFVIHDQACVSCGECQRICPLGAVELAEEGLAREPEAA